MSENCGLLFFKIPVHVFNPFPNPIHENGFWASLKSLVQKAQRQQGNYTRKLPGQQIPNFGPSSISHFFHISSGDGNGNIESVHFYPGKLKNIALIHSTGKERE